MMDILSDVRLNLRVNNTALDIEIQDLIDAAKADLALSGIHPNKIVDTDPLIKRAIIVYCKAHFGWNNPDADRLQRSYEMLKEHLALAGDYQTAVDEE